MIRRKFIKNSLGTLSLLCTGNLSTAGFKKDTFFIQPDERFTSEALFYKITPRGIKCNLCPHNCNVTDIRPGNCRTKIVRNNKLITTAFGNPFYVKTTVPEAENLYHFLPGAKILVIGTAGCNLSCQYCNVYNASQKSPEEISYNSLSPEQLVKMCQSKGVRAIAYGYTEPVAFYEYMLTTAQLAKSKGIRNIMVSNGYINEAPLREIGQYLDAAVISIKAFSEATYQKLAGGSIFQVFETIKTLNKLNVWLELTHVVVPGWTDNFELLEKMVKWMTENNFNDTPFHFQHFEPKFRLRQINPVPENMMEKAFTTANSNGLEYVYNNIHEHTLCPSCKKPIIIRAKGNVQQSKIKNNQCGYCKVNVPGIWNS